MRSTHCPTRQSHRLWRVRSKGHCQRHTYDQGHHLPHLFHDQADHGRCMATLYRADKDGRLEADPTGGGLVGLESAFNTPVPAVATISPSSTIPRPPISPTAAAPFSGMALPERGSGSIRQTILVFVGMIQRMFGSEYPERRSHTRIPQPFAGLSGARRSGMVKEMSYSVEEIR